MMALDDLAKWLGCVGPDEVRRLVAKWSNDGKYCFIEKAAIMEYDGHLSRDEAEVQAYEILRVEFENTEEEADG